METGTGRCQNILSFDGTSYLARPFVQVITKRLWPGLVYMRRENCIFLTAAGRRTQFFLLIFNKPGRSLLVVPCNSVSFLSFPSPTLGSESFDVVAAARPPARVLLMNFPFSLSFVAPVFHLPFPSLPGSATLLADFYFDGTPPLLFLPSPSSFFVGSAPRATLQPFLITLAPRYCKK